MIFLAENLDEICYGENEYEGFKFISKEFIEINRWSHSYRVIFSYQDKFYECFPSYGNTEYQDTETFDSRDVECKEVFPKEKIIIVYEENL